MQPTAVRAEGEGSSERVAYSVYGGEESGPFTVSHATVPADIVIRTAARQTQLQVYIVCMGTCVSLNR